MSQAFGCSGGEIIDCEHVLKSKWSKVFGVPVSVPAIGLYASLLSMLAFVRRDAPESFLKLVWSGLTAGSLMAGLAALWFIGLQVFAMKLCPYCLAVHTCGIILAALMVWNKVSSPQQKGLAATFSMAAVALLVTVQIVTPESDNFTVVRYDDAAPQDRQNPDSVAGETDLFAAPGEVFPAPGEMFAAPGELFEAPAESTSGQQAGVPDAASTDEAVKADNSENGVTSTLLLIMPGRVSLLTQIPFIVPQEEAKSDAAPAGRSAAATDVSQDEPTPSEGDSPATDSASGEPEKSKASEVQAATVPEPPEPRIVTVAGNRISLNVRQWPVLGNPEARYVFVEMFDYTCPHCRNTHHAVKGALEQYGNDLAIVALPVPLESACNRASSGGGHPGACELAKIAVTVWRVNPSKFREFHDWVFESQATAATARKRAEALVGTAEFRKEYSSTIPGDYIKRHVDLYVKVGSGSVPKLMFPQSTMTGEVNNKATLVRTIERELVTVVGK